MVDSEIIMSLYEEDLMQIDQIEEESWVARNNGSISDDCYESIREVLYEERTRILSGQYRG